MVTASHNPPQDNGYKVYLGDGSQIVPPADAEIAARIAAVGALADVPRGDGGDGARRGASSTPTSTPSPAWPADGPRDLRLVYTPLHGVGGTSVVAGARDGPASRAPHVVPEQARARPRLPDRRVPQPRGARRDGPRDGARRASAAPTSSSPTTPTPTAAPSPCPTPHGWRMLRGDEVGALLGRPPAPARASRAPTPCSIVSSSLLGKMAAAAGQPYAETLTGFKWIGRVPGSGVRLRGGARLLRRPRARARQGRRLRAACWSPSWRPS